MSENTTGGQPTATKGSAPARERTGAQEPVDTAGVIVRLGGGRYALPMVAVAEVGRMPVLTRVPGLPAWVAGVANWRGRTLAVLDLRPLLHHDATGASSSARLVVLHRDALTVGLLTEGVHGVATLGDGRTEPPAATLSGSAAELIAGQLTDEAGPVGVLDVFAILRLREGLPRARRTA